MYILLLPSFHKIILMSLNTYVYMYERKYTKSFSYVPALGTQNLYYREAVDERFRMIVGGLLVMMVCFINEVFFMLLLNLITMTRTSTGKVKNSFH